MTSRERVLRTFAFEKTDRVAMQYDANAAVEQRLAAALGVGAAADVREEIRRALGIDMRQVYAEYKGPKLFADVPGLQTDALDGFRMRYIENRFGGYWDFCEFPLQNAAPEQIAEWPMPDPDDFDYATIGGQLAYYDGFAIVAGNAGICDIINGVGRLMGMEGVLIALAERDPATLHHIGRRVSWQLGMLERMIARARCRIDYIWMGEDLGTQIAPLISPDLYRDVMKPFHKRFADFAKSRNLPLMAHSCGASSWAYEDFIEIGVRAVDTLQPEARDMSPRSLKERFGGRLAFHGCISTAGTLVSGTPEEVRATVRETLDIMTPGGGYMMSPSHSIQDNTPVENIIAMYDEARRYPL